MCKIITKYYCKYLVKDCFPWYFKNKMVLFLTFAKQRHLSLFLTPLLSVTRFYNN